MLDLHLHPDGSPRLANEQHHTRRPQLSGGRNLCRVKSCETFVVHYCQYWYPKPTTLNFRSTYNLIRLTCLNHGFQRAVSFFEKNGYLQNKTSSQVVMVPYTEFKSLLQEECSLRTSIVWSMMSIEQIFDLVRKMKWGRDRDKCLLMKNETLVV